VRGLDCGSPGLGALDLVLTHPRTVVGQIELAVRLGRLAEQMRGALAVDAATALPQEPGEVALGVCEIEPGAGAAVQIERRLVVAFGCVDIPDRTSQIGQSVIHA
jgi:hypothetical protein